MGNEEDETKFIRQENLAEANKAVASTSILVASMMERVKQEKAMIEAASASKLGWLVVPYMEVRH